jgi:hypothetical protein
MHFLLIGAVIVIALCFKFRIQEVCVPTFINLNSKKYLVVREDVIAMDEASPQGFPIKKVYYIKRW